MARAVELAHEREVEHVALDEAEVRVLGEVGAGERVAVQVVEDHDLVLVDEAPREVVPMKPAPPVVKIFFPLRGTTAESTRRSHSDCA